HEIRNPLAAAKGHAQLLAEQIPESERQRRWVDVVVEQIERIEALSGQLLDFARGGRLQREAVAPAELLREAADALAAGRFAFDVERAPASWSVDRSRLRQVLTNLLQNAVQASPPDKPIDATAAQERGMLVFTVRDRGPGLPPGEGERIFEPFHTTRLRGTGLGLAVARRLAELHGGTIEARDHPEGGAEFRVLIPPPAES
ncbi:MAG: HAMP domain-containing histidine kinase, partial [Deltaproteobacteria bacterium]|nr:HAMP domain-containing histidine kinase [Deltaproteobacteria bacterium]